MIPFVTHKYGRELLVDAGWIHEYPETFVLSDAPHRLAFYEVLLVTAGNGQLWLRGVPHEVAPDRVFLTAPGEERCWEARGVDGRCLFFTAEFLTEYFVDTAFLSRLRGFRTGHPAPVAALDRRLLGEARRRLRYDDAPAARIAVDLGFDDPAYSRFAPTRRARRPSASASATTPACS
jgi:hypothetical protein